MTDIPYIRADDVHGHLTWTDVVESLAAGHRLPHAQIDDMFLSRGEDTFLNRAAWISGVGFGVKSVSVIADNDSRHLPTVQGLMIVFDDVTGSPRAIIDSDLVTRWKTAGDSVLGARHLARPDSRNLLIIGAGEVAESLVEAYSEIFPGLESICIWNRTNGRATALVETMAGRGIKVEAVDDLQAAVAKADIVSTATMSHQPVLNGGWLSPGTHVDLIGAFRADMREADDDVLRRGRLFVDSRETTVRHIGELMIPLAAGVITEQDILGDLNDLEATTIGRVSSDDITVYKNGGGAHLDLMTAQTILTAWQNTAK